MAFSDWVGLGLEGANWWQQRANRKDSQDYINKSSDQAKQDVQQWQAPYAQFGQEHMKGYNELGDFNFQFDQSDPSYQWRYDQGLQGVQRTQAGNKMLGSGNTLAELTKYGQGMASQEYQAEFDRDLASYDTNKDYRGFGVKTGADAARNIGDNLADISLGQGQMNAYLQAEASRANSETLSNIGKGFGDSNSAQSKLINEGAKYAADKMGLSGEGAADWISSKYGIAKENVMQTLGIGGIGSGGAAGSATTMFGGGSAAGMGTGSAAMGAAGTGEAAMGITGMGEGFGGSYSAGLAAAEGSGATATGATSAATAGFGTWAASVAGGAGVLIGIKMLNETLGSDPRIGKTLKKLSTSQDPLGDIGKMSSKDYTGLFERDETHGAGSSTHGGRGMLYGAIIGAMPPESIPSLFMRDDVEMISANMMSAITDGREQRDKYTGGNIGSTAEAMGKMYPEIAQELQSLEAISQANRDAESYNQSQAGDFGLTRQPREIRDTSALEARIRAHIKEKLATAKNQRQIAGMAAF